MSLLRFSYPALCPQFNHLNPFPYAPISLKSQSTHTERRYFVGVTQKPTAKSTDFLTHIKELEEDEEDDDDEDNGTDEDEENEDYKSKKDADAFDARTWFEEKAEAEGQELEYEKNPEYAEILGDCLEDPDKARAKMEDRMRKKRNKIVTPKNGSATPMKVTFNNFDFNNSYIWFEFHNAPLDKDTNLICDVLRSWHIVGRLGGCNALNLQLSENETDKRPSYDAAQGANMEPSTFYNIGDLEFQDNLARVWVDIGAKEPLLLDILINALTQISADHVGIKQVVFGGSSFENWKENLTSEEAGYSVHKI